MSQTFLEHAAGWRLSDWYALRARRRHIIACALALAFAALYAAAIVASDGNAILVVSLVALLVALVVMTNTTVGLYLLFGAAILFEQWEVAGVTPITANARLFQNLSAYTPIPLRLSLVDLLAFLTVASFGLRLALAKQPALRAGPFGWPVAAYGAVFAIGAVVGAARGGQNLDAALAEARAPLQLCLLYFLTANLIRERGQVWVLAWVFVALTAVKGLQGLFNYQEAASLGLSLEAVTGREDVVFFDVAVGLLLVMAILKARTRLAFALAAVLPLIFLAELLTERRFGFVALGAVVLVIALLTLVDDPHRGLVFVVLGAVAVGAYLVLFWDNDGPLGEPARALRSVLGDRTISVRDQLSNRWRDIENHNIAYTVRQLPLTGVGVGQAYLFQLEPPAPNFFAYWRYMTHNALLWLWLKAGPLGALALWFLVARVVLVCSALYVRLRDPGLRPVALLPVVLLVTQIVFSSVELGLTYSRSMIVLGTGLGLGAFLIEAAATERGRRDVRRAVPGGSA
jgi:O-antigen ligase